MRPPPPVLRMMREYFGSLRDYLKRLGRAVRGALRRRAPPLRIAFACDAALLRTLDAATDDGSTAQAALAAWLEAHADFPLRRDDVAEAIAWITRHRPAWRARWYVEYPPGLRAVPVYGHAIPLARIAAQHRHLGPGADVLYDMGAQQFGFWPRWVLAGLARGDDLREPLEFLQRWQAGVATTSDPIAYADNLQVTFRAFALITSLPFVLAAGNAALACACARTVAADVAFVRARLGRSYPNNHLLGELFLVCFAARLLGELLGASAPAPDAEAEWFAQCERQLHADGTSFEHSVHYHELVCQMMACYRRACTIRGHDLPPSFEDRLARALAFQVAINGDDASALAIGDTTEDCLLALAPPGWSTAALARLLQAWYPDAAVRASRGASEEAAFWLLGGRLPQAPVRTQAQPLQRFDCGGFYVLCEPDADARLVFRTGPAPGRALNPGHMHADLLSVYLNVRGTRVLVEAGTATYRCDPAAAHPGWWRQYFLSAPAHNGLALDGLDPLARGDGDFPGSIHAAVPVHSRIELEQCHSAAGLTLVAARNVGDSAYAGHRRAVLHMHGAGWLVWDRFPAHAAARSVGWQFAPDVTLEPLAPGAHLARVAACRVVLAADPGAQPEQLCGQHEPPGGWYSARYGEAQPAPQLRHHYAADAAFGAFALLPGGGEAVTLEPALRDDGVLHLGVTLARERWDLWVGDGAPARVQEPGVDASAEVLWVRRSAAGIGEIRALGARAIAVPELHLYRDGERPEDLQVSC